MRKIKDLCTVIVDNAFLLRPIDHERYELMICALENLLCHRVAEEDRDLHYSNDAAKEWASSTEDTLLLACQNSVSLYDQPERFSESAKVLANDRYVRLRASADRCGFLEDFEYARMCLDVDELMAIAWACILMTMRNTPGFLPLGRVQ